MHSNEGPRMATGDVNGDGLDDLFIGGAKGSPGELFIQEKALSCNKFVLFLLTYIFRPDMGRLLAKSNRLRLRLPQRYTITITQLTD